MTDRQKWALVFSSKILVLREDTRTKLTSCVELKGKV